MKSRNFGLWDGGMTKKRIDEITMLLSAKGFCQEVRYYVFCWDPSQNQSSESKWNHWQRKKSCWMLRRLLFEPLSDATKRHLNSGKIVWTMRSKKMVKSTALPRAMNSAGWFCNQLSSSEWDYYTLFSEFRKWWIEEACDFPKYQIQ